MAISLLCCAVFLASTGFDDDHNSPDEVPFDFSGYVYEDCYFDLREDDHILANWNCSDPKDDIYGPVDYSLRNVANGVDRIIGIYSDETCLDPISQKLGIKDIMKGNGFHIITFSGVMNVGNDEMMMYGNAYADMHPEKSGIQPIPTYWNNLQYYLMDDATGKLYYLPFNAGLYDYDNREFIDTNYAMHEGIGIIGCSNDYLYYSIERNHLDSSGIFRMRVIDGIVEHQRLFDLGIFTFKGVTLNNILYTNDTAVWPDGKRADLSDGCYVLGGLICRNIQYLEVENWNDVRASNINGYPASADYLSEDGIFIHKEYTLDESKTLVEESAYRCCTAIQDYYTQYYSPDLFDIVRHKYYKGTEIIDYTDLEFNGSNYSVHVESMDLGNVIGYCYNWYVIFENSSLYLYDLNTKVRHLVSDDVYHVNCGFKTTWRFVDNMVYYIDNDYAHHSVYFLPDGTIAEGSRARAYYIFL